MKGDCKGKVYPQYHVTCGMCGNENPLGTTDKAQVAYYLERGGYVKTKEYGYVCERCRQGLPVPYLCFV